MCSCALFLITWADKLVIPSIFGLYSVQVLEIDEAAFCKIKLRCSLNELKILVDISSC